MIGLDRWEQQPGGLYLAATPFDKTKPEHRTAAVGVARNLVQTVSGTHGAAVGENGLHANLHAIHTGGVKLVFFKAKWEVCAPEDICVGASLNWNTVGLNREGLPGRSIYTEDVCILSSKLRQLIRARPDGKEFPAESLAECFERISLQNMLKNEGAWFRFGEVNRNNTTMMRQLNGNGAVIGTGPDSAVLELKRLPNDLWDRFPMNVETIHLRKDGEFDANNFIVRWHEGPHDIRFIATKGQATAAGHSRADIRPWHNGNLPEQSVLQLVVASSLNAIRYEAESDRRRWGDQYGQKPGVFGGPLPDAHIYVIGDQPMLDAFAALGAMPRVFGDRPMIPGVNVLKPEIRLVA